MFGDPGAEWSQGRDGAHSPGSSERDVRTGRGTASGCDQDSDACPGRIRRTGEPGCAISRVGSASESVGPVATANDQRERATIGAIASGDFGPDADPDCNRGVDTLESSSSPKSWDSG